MRRRRPASRLPTTAAVVTASTPYRESLRYSVDGSMPSTSAARDLLPLSLCSTHMMYARSTASSVGFGGVRVDTSGSARALGDPLGQRADVDLVARRENHRALERVLQFAHVARPRVLGSSAERRIG